MSFFDFCAPVLSDNEPLRLPMGAGSYVTKDPEVRNATVCTNGGDEAYSGMLPSTSQQSVAEKGGMSPQTTLPEPDIDVKPIARVYHLTYNDDDEYKVTRIEIETVATIKINGEQLSISHNDAIEAKMWDLDMNDVKAFVEGVESTTAEKAFKFMTKRRELLDTLKAMKVELMLEKVVEEEYFEDDP